MTLSRDKIIEALVRNIRNPTFQLTRSEEFFVDDLIDGLTFTEISSKRNTSTTTVKGKFDSVRRKLSCRALDINYSVSTLSTIIRDAFIAHRSSEWSSTNNFVAKDVSTTANEDQLAKWEGWSPEGITVRCFNRSSLLYENVVLTGDLRTYGDLWKTSNALHILEHVWKSTPKPEHLPSPEELSALKISKLR